MIQNFNAKYLQQVRLLIRLLASVQKEKCFALKGGTAINLFVRDMPRLSIDIDLTYLPLDDRVAALQNLEDALTRIKSDIQRINKNILIDEKRSLHSKNLQKLIIGKDERIKIEPNTILRGCLYPITYLKLSQKAEEVFELSIDKVPVLSLPDLYAGKICAALDRQHPRDLFDIALLYKNEGLTNEIRHAFVIYLACSPRPMHELLQPNLINQQKLFEQEFVGMADIDFEYSEFEEIRLKLINHLQKQLTDQERQFLFSIKQGEPNYKLMTFENLDKLPALQWKLSNIKNMDNKKQNLMLGKLEKILFS